MLAAKVSGKEEEQMNLSKTLLEAINYLLENKRYKFYLSCGIKYKYLIIT